MRLEKVSTKSASPAQPTAGRLETASGKALGAARGKANAAPIAGIASSRARTASCTAAWTGGLGRHMAANVWLAACLVLALGIYLSPFIAGTARRLANGHAQPYASRTAAPSAFTHASTSRLAAGPGEFTRSAVSGLPEPALGQNLLVGQASVPTELLPAGDGGGVLTLGVAEGNSHELEYAYCPIEELREGDLVVATDPATGETRLARVVHTFRRLTYHLRHLVLQDSTGNTQHIETTDEHPFFDACLNDFVAAGKLRVGDTLRGPMGEPLYVVETRYERHPEGVAVFNIEVEDLHTYYISAHGARAPPALVHNARCDLHHPIPKFLGGDATQKLTKLSKKVHNEFHRLLRTELKAAGFTLPVGGVRGSTREWRRLFLSEPGSQAEAFAAVLGASRVIDAKYKTKIAKDFLENFRDGRFTSYP